MRADGIVGGSFRDPSGFVFRRDGVVYRQVNTAAAAELALLESSGLYGELVDAGLLVSHSDADVFPPSPGSAARVIRPEQIPFVSYPYEWCFGQLQDAALTTLEIQLVALRHTMTLKDASAFNIQFLHGRPVLIDTLSFEQYEEGSPWVAYRQFCEHFLAPLMLISRVDPLLGRLSALTADGVPLQTASRLLPWTTRLRPAALLHVHLHARSVDRYGGRRVPDRVKSRGLSRRGMQNLIEGLKHTIDGLKWKPEGTEWAEYDVEHGYASDSMAAKRELVSALLNSIAPAVVWDLGANTGDFSRLALETGASVISMDLDPAAVERNYRRMRANGETELHPLWADLRSPSPGLGWAEDERDGLTARSSADCVLGLALVHHLAIGGNVPLPRLLEWFSSLARHLIVEFVPKEDPQVQRLLVSREDVFPDYSRTGFEKALEDLYEVDDARELPSSGRVIYHGIRRTA
jgi:hypothetical protein